MKEEVKKLDSQNNLWQPFRRTVANIKRLIGVLVEVNQNAEFDGNQIYIDMPASPAQAYQLGDLKFYFSWEITWNEDNMEVNLTVTDYENDGNSVVINDGWDRYDNFRVALDIISAAK